MTNKTLFLFAIAMFVVVSTMGFLNDGEQATKPAEKSSSGYKWDEDWREGDEASEEVIEETPQKPVEQPVMPIKKKGLVASSYAQALEMSDKEGMPILLIFSGNHCPYCVEMENNVFPNPKVKVIMDDYVVFKVDTSRQENLQLSAKMGVEYIPAFAITNAKEEKLKFEQKSMNIDQFVNFLSDSKFKKTEVKEVEKPKPEKPRQEARKPIFKKPRSVEKPESLSPPDPDSNEWYGY